MYVCRLTGRGPNVRVCRVCRRQQQQVASSRRPCIRMNTHNVMMSFDIRSCESDIGLIAIVASAERLLIYANDYAFIRRRRRQQLRASNHGRHRSTCCITMARCNALTTTTRTAEEKAPGYCAFGLHLSPPKKKRNRSIGSKGTRPQKYTHRRVTSSHYISKVVRVRTCVLPTSSLPALRLAPSETRETPRVG